MDDLFSDVPQPSSPGPYRRPRFNGPDYVAERDDERLDAQFWRIFKLMADCGWRSLAEIGAATGDPPASISAQLRHMRKERFGGHTVNKRYIGDGLFQYQLIPTER